MDYRIFSMSTGEEDNSTEAHVFARAYRGAWRPSTARSRRAGIISPEWASSLTSAHKRRHQSTLFLKICQEGACPEFCVI